MQSTLQSITSNSLAATEGKQASGALAAGAAVHVALAGRIVLLALAYWAFARFGTWLAIPPGYSSALWAPAGIALMALLSGGSRLWPGVLAGSFAHNILISIEACHTGPLALALSAVVAGAATLQALAGAWLVRRYVGYPTALGGVRDTVRFLLLGGPLACLLSASIGTGSLAVAGVIPSGAIAFSWFNWWAGDAIGVLLTAPFWLVAAGEPRALWRARWLSVALPVLALLLAALGAFAIAQRQEAARIRAEFAARALDVRRHIDDALDDDVVLLDTIRGHLDATATADASSFAVVARSVLTRHGSLQALEWAPVVGDADRPAFERRAERVSPAPAITERARDGAIVVRTRTQRYVPVDFIEPLEGNATALGFDLASDPARREAIEAVGRTGAAALTQPLRLVQDSGAAQGVLAFVPVYREPAAAVLAPKALRGYVVGVIALPHLLEVALKEVDLAGLEYRLVDATDPARSVPVAMHTDPRDPAVADPESGGTVEAIDADVRAPGRHWRLQVRPTLGFLDSARTPMPWIIQICGLLFAALIGTLLLELAGRRQQVVLEVEQRTSELSERNRQLLHEIAERERAQAARRESEARFETAFENTANGILIEDRAGIIERANPAMCALLGYSREELLGVSLYDLTHPDDVAASAEHARQLWSGAVASYQLEKRYLARDGHAVWVGISCALIRDADGQPRHLVGQIHDLTGRKQLEKALIEATNNEQRRLGHELHDGLGQELTGMAMLVAALRSGETKAGREVPRHFLELERIAKRTITTCRAIAHGLSPLSYVRGDLIAALRELVALQQQAYGARTSFQAAETAALALPPHALDHLYRIAQEAISNARRHAGARTISVTLSVEPGHVRVEIADDGAGLARGSESTGGMGLKIMKYRAGMIGATLSIEAAHAGGTRVRCECPQTSRVPAAVANA